MARAVFGKARKSYLTFMLKKRVFRMKNTKRREQLDSLFTPDNEEINGINLFESSLFCLIFFAFHKLPVLK